MIVGPRFHVPSRAVILAGTLSLVVDGVMVGISFHVEVGVVPQFDSCRSTDGRCSVGSRNAAVFLKLGQTPSTSAQNDCCLSLSLSLSWARFRHALR